MPRISLVLGVKNGLPHLRTAIDALRHQTYRGFEVVVQDGVSTDGSLEYLQSISDLDIKLVSEPDSGIGQAYNRGISRAHGDLLVMASCDEYLDDDAIQKGVDWHSRYADAAVVYGAVRLADAAGRILQVFFPPPYELTAIIKNEIVMPAGATFFNRKRIGEDMYYDESLKTCPDYDFWLRLGTRFGADQIVGVSEAILTAQSDRSSQTFRSESFDQFCKDKLWILERFLDGRGNGPQSAALRKAGHSGILLWAAESVFEIEGASPAFLHWCQEAEKFDPQSSRLARLAGRTQAFRLDPFEIVHDIQPDAPTSETESLPLESAQTFAYWEGAEVQHERVSTGEKPWSYAAQIPLPDALQEDRWYWIKLDLRVETGQVGVSVFTGDHLRNERLLLPSDGRTTVWLKIGHAPASAVMIRNGSFPGRSALDIFESSLESCAKRG